MEHLQEIVDKKKLQVADILNNLEHGLFTINLDGTINDEFSVITKKMFKLDNIALSNIADLFRMSLRQRTAFFKWLDLVSRMHSQVRWQKLSKLAPIQEIEIHDNSNHSTIVSLKYQRIEDSNGQLSRIMILAVDITEKRLKELQIAAERQRHESDIKAILSIANVTSEELSKFMEDTAARLGDLLSQVESHLNKISIESNESTHRDEYIISDEALDALYRDVQAIKNNCSFYGFDILAMISLQTEDLLEKLRQQAATKRCEDFGILKELLVKMNDALDEIYKKIKLIIGDSEEITVRIPENHVNTIIEKCNALSNVKISPALQELIDECKKLAWKPLGVLLRKYQKSALQVAGKLHKNVDIVIKNEKQFFNPIVISRLDEILMQLVRNAVDHGIESPEIRDELGKSTGKIYIEIDIIDEFCFLVVSDDGRGIDVEALLTNAVNKKFITPEEAVRMSADEKIALLFKSSLSTSKVPDEVSGRGMGMDIVKHRIEALGGTISTNSIFGKGTTFCLKVPIHSLM